MAYKLGRSEAARSLAVSHTGALAGEDDIADVFLAECGIARVHTLEGLIEGFPMVARIPALPRGKTRGGVAVVTTTAGGAARGASRASCVTTLTTPGGRSAWRQMSAKARADRGVNSAGLRITLLPVARAGPSFQAAMIIG